MVNCTAPLCWRALLGDSKPTAKEKEQNTSSKGLPELPKAALQNVWQPTKPIVGLSACLMMGNVLTRMARPRFPYLRCVRAARLCSAAQCSCAMPASYSMQQAA
eukprot:3883061-Pleurochrysis_carterae.AAC.3